MGRSKETVLRQVNGPYVMAWVKRYKTNILKSGANLKGLLNIILARYPKAELRFQNRNTFLACVFHTDETGVCDVFWDDFSKQERKLLKYFGAIEYAPGQKCLVEVPIMKS